MMNYRQYNEVMQNILTKYTRDNKKFNVPEIYGSFNLLSYETQKGQSKIAYTIFYCEKNVKELTLRQPFFKESIIRR